MANFFLRDGSSGAGAGKTALQAAKYKKTATAVGFGNTTYTAASEAAAASAPGEIRKGFTPPGILSNVSVHIQGIGLTIRAEATIIVYSASGIGVLTGLLGSDMSVSIPGYSKTFQCYDLSFNNIKPSGWEITVKGIAKNEIRSYEFVDISSGNIPSKKVFAMSIYDYKHSEDLTGTEMDSRFKSQQINSSKLLTEGNSLADYLEGTMLEGGPGLTGTFEDFFGVKVALFNATANKYGYLGVVTSGQPKRWKGSFYTVMRAFGFPGLLDSTNVFNKNGFCGWANLSWIFAIMNAYVLKPLGKKIAYNSEFSKVHYPTNDRWVGSDPLNNVFFHNGSSFDVTVDKYYYFQSGNKVVYKPDCILIKSSDFYKTTDSKYPDYIYFNTSLIRKIQDEVSKPNPNTGEDVPLEQRALGTFPFGRFMEKLFDAVRGATGGIVDLTFDMNKSNTSKIYVVSRKPGNANVSAMSVPLGTRNDEGYGIRDVKVSGNVPKSLAARLFGKAPETTGLSKVFNSPSTPAAPSWDVAAVGRAIGNNGFFHQPSTDTIQDGCNSIGLAKIQSIATMDPPALPTEITATVDGNASIDVFQAVNIKPALSVTGGSGVIWAITDVTHKANGTDFVTEFKAIARLKA